MDMVSLVLEMGQEEHQPPARKKVLIIVEAAS
jgi:hypothetical protein